jgi:hypothetical protein
MPTTIIAFPPVSGGNHLKNIIKNIDHRLYTGIKTVHQTPGQNMQQQQVELALSRPTDKHLLHGHFGEIMSYRNQICQIKSKKFIIICCDDADDNRLLNERRKKLNRCTLDVYFDGEQIFLYESFMYHEYFDTPMEDIMNISISEWFTEDISAVLHRINYFLNNSIDIESAKKLHTVWYERNFK